MEGKKTKKNKLKNKTIGREINNFVSLDIVLKISGKIYKCALLFVI